jgi:phosphoglycolate phosphatase
VPPAAVIFDLDGVLVDSRAAISSCMNHALVAHGRPAVPEAELHGFIGPPLVRTFATLLGVDEDSDEVAACIAAYRERYATVSLTDTTVVPGIVAVLESLGGSYRLAVATSKPLPFTEPLLGALGLAGHFEVIAGPALDALMESKATTVASALAGLGTADAVMIGDRSFDMLGAEANGIPGIGVTWGIGDAAELTEAGAWRLVHQPGELVEAVPSVLAG